MAAKPREWSRSVSLSPGTLPKLWLCEWQRTRTERHLAEERWTCTWSPQRASDSKFSKFTARFAIFIISNSVARSSHFFPAENRCNNELRINPPRNMKLVYKAVVDKEWNMLGPYVLRAWQRYRFKQFPHWQCYRESHLSVLHWTGTPHQMND